MGKITITLLSFLLTSGMFAQGDFNKLPQAKTTNITYLIVPNVIGNENLLNSLGATKEGIKSKIKEVSVFKEKPTRAGTEFYNLTEFGIVSFELFNSPAVKTQKELNNFFGLDEQTDVYVDGYLFESKKINIATTSIEEIELVKPDSINLLKGTILNIWTLEKDKRYKQ
ncbi:hypothetical protein QSV08_10010 [Maribacter sp. BPC-D8]|uniref:hypothetical protein n=1 Tax=Maribacter sp. BPC-D8 TaxID=3053613 RepID=UPI002B45C01C|nr:hypothetical protein [Maribacter sp. BPC-D8]WRI31571.1 hypothetical protein QSV08_10010 [Maribacter sp. BPC-D8]